MIIDKNLCKKCGKCIIECSNKAISKNNDGDYFIDQTLCINCSDCSDIECIRYCKFNAITKDDGTVVEFDTTPRLLSGHIPYVAAIMGDRGKTGLFPLDNREWKEFRKLIAAAFTDTELKIRIVYGNDDICSGCPRKQAGCKEGPDGAHFKRLGIEPGTVIKFWDLMEIFEDKYSMQFMKDNLYSINDVFLDCVRTFVSPDAKILTNE